MNPVLGAVAMSIRRASIKRVLGAVATSIPHQSTRLALGVAAMNTVVRLAVVPVRGCTLPQAKPERPRQEQ